MRVIRHTIHQFGSEFLAWAYKLFPGRNYPTHVLEEADRGRDSLLLLQVGLP